MSSLARDAVQPVASLEGIADDTAVLMIKSVAISARLAERHNTLGNRGKSDLEFWERGCRAFDSALDVLVQLQLGNAEARMVHRYRQTPY